MFRRHLGRLFSVIALCLSFSSAFANPYQYHFNAPDNKLHFILTPSVFFFGQNGDFIATGSNASVDTSPIDVFRSRGNVDSLFGFHTEIGRNKWAFMVDRLYLKASPQTTVLGVNTKTAMKILKIDAGMWYRLMKHQFKNRDCWLTWEVLWGLRYAYGNIFIPLTPTTAATGHGHWIAPMIGSRTVLHYNDRWSIWYRSGFAAIGSEIWSYDSAIYAAYKIRKRWSAMFGFRAVGLHSNDTRGTNRIEFKVINYGPEIGVTFHA